MKFLIKFYQFLVKFFQGFKRTSNDVKIPREIAGEELIVRGVVEPMFFDRKKQKLEVKSFLPPGGKKNADRKDVSVLRHNYTNSNHCKQHIKEKVVIPENQYTGLAILQAKNVEEVNDPSFILLNGEQLRVDIKATPMDDLKMHADILYSHGAIPNEPNTYMRKMATALISKAKYLHDPNPNETNWNGVKINNELFQ